jgi:hypothetical protein
MVDKKPECADVILELFRKRQGFAHEASTTLAKGIVEAFNMIGKTRVFADRTMAF